MKVRSGQIFDYDKKISTNFFGKSVYLELTRPNQPRGKYKLLLAEKFYNFFILRAKPQNLFVCFDSPLK